MTTEQETMDGTPALVKLEPDLPIDCGFIKFQLGPVGEVGRNGTTIEHVIDVLKARLEGFQRGPFACEENARAIAHLDLAGELLAQRTAARQAQGVEGTNAPHVSSD